MNQIVGFIGLGVLGSAVVKNFVESGLTVIGYDTSSTACSAAEALGVSVVTSPAMVSASSDLVFTCLPNNDALQSVLHGDKGLLSENADQHSDDQIIVEMSTLSVADKTSFENACIENGLVPVDCPVSGNRIMALNRKLTAFYSGGATAYSRVSPVLDLTCGKTHNVGEFGNGTKVKLCGNILNLVHNTVAAEAMVLAMKSGLDPKLFHEVISGSGSSSAMFEVRGGLMVDEDYQKEAMNMSVPLKDARIISDHAASLFCPIPLYQAALQNYYAAAAQGLADKDAAVVCEVMERAANHHRTPTEKQ